jgi:hypothetical protein
MLPIAMTRRFRSAAAILIVALLGLASASASGAAPVSYFALPGDQTNTIDDLTVGSDATLWVAQTLSWGPANTERHMRILHVSRDGTLLAATSEQEGDPLFTQMVPAADGGVWVNAGRLEHVTSAGTVDPVTALGAGGTDLVAGKDGRAWLQRCNFVSSHAEECKAVAVDTAGEVETYDLSGLSATWPAGATGASEVHNSVASQDGIWFWKLFRGDGGPVQTYAEFISYQGTGMPITTVPAESFLAASAGGDSAWWLRNEQFVGATLGEVDVGGQISNIHHMGNLSLLPEHPDGFTADPGRDGSLVWAQNATWNDEFDGQIGIASLGGSNTSFGIEHNATAVPTSTPDFWSGSCTFGVKTFQATDGSLWTISGGHPARLTRQQPTGQFSTFLLDGASAFTSEQEIGIWGMDETSPHELWFTMNTPHGPELARLDPLDPPPAEPRMPKAESGSSSVWNGREHPPSNQHRTITRLLRSLVAQARFQLRHAGAAGGKLSLNVDFPVPGTAQVKVTRQQGHRAVSLAVGNLQGSGHLTMLIPFRPALVRLLRDSRAGTRAAISAGFRPADGSFMSKKASIHLPG